MVEPSVIVIFCGRTSYCSDGINVALLDSSLTRTITFESREDRHPAVSHQRFFCQSIIYFATAADNSLITSTHRSIDRSIAHISPSAVANLPNQCLKASLAVTCSLIISCVNLVPPDSTGISTYKREQIGAKRQ